MKEEKALASSNNGFFSNIIKKIKIKLFGINHKEEQEVTAKNMKTEKLSNVELLKEIMNGNIDINEIDYNTKQELINMCYSRITEINEEINQMEDKNKRINKLLNELKEIRQ